jgi:hypothetical protein
MFFIIIYTLASNYWNYWPKNKIIFIYFYFINKIKILASMANHPSPIVYKNACAVYDWTSYYDVDNVDTVTLLIEECKTYFKKWAFQMEECPSTGNKHFQGRGSLKVKRLPSAFMKDGTLKLHHFGHLSPTSKEIASTGDFMYVMKNETRVKGPWTDKDQPKFIPMQLIGFGSESKPFMPFQTYIEKSTTIFEERKTNIVFDPQGSIGKSTIVQYLVCHKEACIKIPPFKELKDVLRAAYDQTEPIFRKNNNTIFTFFIDMPRAMKKTHLSEFYAGIEYLKGGDLVDDRNTYRALIINPPVIWITTNTLPDFNYLTYNRWNLLGINKDSKMFEELEVPTFELKTPTLKLKVYKQKALTIDELRATQDQDFIQDVQILLNKKLNIPLPTINVQPSLAVTPVTGLVLSPAVESYGNL